MHHDILSLLDAHLVELHTLRERLAAPRPVHPGERRAAAAETISAAERYTEAAGELLGVASV